jgi:hypothetical protein
MAVVAEDTFGTHSSGLDSPYAHAAAITKSDTDELAYVTRGIYVGGAGNINLVTVGGETVLFTAPPVGKVLRVRAKQILSTSTTATALVALW